MSLKRIIEYFNRKIWLVRLSEIPTKRVAYTLKISRILTLTAKFFTKNHCILHASALTYYTLLSIVQVLALVFGIAKGYGFDETLKSRLTESMAAQPETAQKIIGFAESYLKHTSGGLIAGVGVLLLIWTAVKLLAGIENAFNEIWGVRVGRSWVRKLSDYLTMLLIFPLMIAVVASSSTFVIKQLQTLVANLPFSDTADCVILFAAKGLPLLVSCLVFFFFFIFIPNTKVRVRSALYAGIFTGILYFAIQHGYVIVQKMLTSYNAVYGTFAALPFFLIYLQITWILVLIGAQLSFAHQNMSEYEMQPGDGPVSFRYKCVSALRIMAELVTAFKEHRIGMTANELSSKLKIPIRSTRMVIYELCSAKLVAELMSDKGSDDAYQIAIPENEITPLVIIEKLSSTGESGLESDKKFESIISSFSEAVRKTEENKPLES